MNAVESHKYYIEKRRNAKPMSNDEMGIDSWVFGSDSSTEDFEISNLQVVVENLKDDEGICVVSSASSGSIRIDKSDTTWKVSGLAWAPDEYWFYTATEVVAQVVMSISSIYCDEYAGRDAIRTTLGKIVFGKDYVYLDPHDEASFYEDCRIAAIEEGDDGNVDTTPWNERFLESPEGLRHLPEESPLIYND